MYWFSDMYLTVLNDFITAFGRNTTGWFIIITLKGCRDWKVIVFCRETPARWQELLHHHFVCTSLTSLLYSFWFWASRISYYKLTSFLASNLMWYTIYILFIKNTFSCFLIASFSSSYKLIYHPLRISAIERIHFASTNVCNHFC